MTEPGPKKKDITIKPANEPAAVVSDDNAILAMIERAARDPAIDIDKMERLFGMRERMLASTAKSAYLAALSRMQPELPVIDKKGWIKSNVKDDDGKKTGQQKKQSGYAKWEDVVEGITPVTSRHGFSTTFRIAQPSPDRVVVTCVLGHEGGHSEETSISLPLDTSGSKNNVQGWGSSVSYGKRYTAFALLNIVARGEDDDGAAGGGSGTISEDQATELMQLLQSHEADIPAFCRYFKIAAVAALPADQFERAKTAITSPKRRQK